MNHPYRCAEHGLVGDHYRNGKTGSGNPSRYRYCPPCNRLNAMTAWALDPEGARERMRAYYRANSETEIARNRAYRHGQKMCPVAQGVSAMIRRDLGR